MANDDLALIAARFGAALRGAGVPADPARCARFAAAVTVARPASRYQLYLCALATLVTGQAQVETLRRVFAAFFGARTARQRGQPGRDAAACRAAPDDLLADAARAAQRHGLPWLARGDTPEAAPAERAIAGGPGVVPPGRTAAGRGGAGRPARARAAPSGSRWPTARRRTDEDEDGTGSRHWPAGRSGWPAPTSPS